MIKVIEQIQIAQQEFKKRLLEMDSSGGLTKDRYIRFLSVQYHLNMGVQKTFFAIAANSVMLKKRELRKWLIQFAQEEESHFEIARADLKELGTEPLPRPLDVALWWAHFEKFIESRPFVRLGGTCILENIGEQSEDILGKMISNSSYLNPKNLRYLTIHRHGANLDHGNQVLEMLSSADLTEDQLSDILYGATSATLIYLRIAYWVVHGKELF